MAPLMHTKGNENGLGGLCLMWGAYLVLSPLHEPGHGFWTLLLRGDRKSVNLPALMDTKERRRPRRTNVWSFTKRHRTTRMAWYPDAVLGR